MKSIAGIALFAGLALAQSNSSDMQFAKNAAIGGMTEVELGKMAVQKSSNDKVKTFGQRLVDDHTKANDQLKSLAAKDNFSLPSSLDAKHQAVVDRFSKMSGTSFDRAFLKDEVRDHEEDIAAFRNEANNGSNQDLKDFASNNLSTLQDHLKMAQDAQQSLNVTSRK